MKRQSLLFRPTVLNADASVLAVAVAVADDGKDGDVARVRLRGEALATPEVVDFEVISLSRRQNRTGAFDHRRAASAMTDLQALPIQRATRLPLLDRCWGLPDDLTTYDVAHVALAEALNATLLTGDRGLARAPGPTCTIELFEGPS